VRMQLERLGFSVTEATSGTEALDLCAAEDQPFDLLLSDVTMPGQINGWVLSEEVGRRWPAMARVLMSGNPQNAVPEAPDRDGSVHLLNKPFRMQHLARVLNEALSS